MDLDVFECPICFSVFQGSIFQCKNGHVVCNACREPVGDIRCRALESAIAGMALPCSFRIHGCTQLLKHTERRDHEALLCQHALFTCPLQGCTYSGLLLYDHIRDEHTSFVDYIVSFVGSVWRVWLHRSRPFMVLLDQVERRVFLLLNGGHVRLGRSLSVVCLGPCPTADQLEYKLEVGGVDQSSALLLSASGSVSCIRSWAGKYPTDGFLFVPNTYLTSFESVIVDVYVQKSTVNDADGSLATLCPCSEVDTFWSSLVRWLRHPSLETSDLLLLLRVFVSSTAVAVLFGLAWKTRSLGK